jgi:phosphatidylglycerol:prolipoprotein diacylglycerol transferase
MQMDAEHFAIHSVFDALAWVAAALMALWLTRRGDIAFPVSPAQRASYYAALISGSAIGAYLFGTLNMIACGQTGLARSIEGAIFGAVFGVEAYKRLVGLHARTGARFAAPLAIGVAVGRIGCYYAGIDDFTYGTPTDLPWGHDFGDGIMRHPAPLYESASMAAFLIVYLAAVFRRDRFLIDNGLYLAIGWYAVQRFVWEFFKPYTPIIGPFTVFHLLSIILLIYSAFMLITSRREIHERALPA